MMLAVSISTPAVATEDETGAWLIASVTGTIGEPGDSHWRYAVDAQSRYLDPGSDIHQWLIRPAIGYALSERTKVWVGYAHLQSRGAVGNYAEENRYWQQLDWTTATGSGKFTLRGRLEQRDISIGTDRRHVLRIQSKYVRPIGGASGRELILSLEQFFDLNVTDWGGDTGINQNRTIIGMGWRVGDALRFESGYMNQYIFAESGPDRSNHLAVLHFKLKF